MTLYRIEIIFSEEEDAEVKYMARLTVATVKTQLAEKGLILRISPGKGYSVYTKGQKRNILEVQFKNLQDLVDAYLPTGKINPRKMLKVEGIKEAVTHANNLTKMDTASIKKEILKIFKGFDKKEIQKVMIAVEQREMSLAEVNAIINQSLPIKSDNNRAIFLNDNNRAKELFKQLRENFAVDMAGQFFLSQVK